MPPQPAPTPPGQPHWPQHLIRFVQWADAEDIAVRHLLPVLTAADNDHAQWWFVRKAPTWRLRHRPPPDTTPHPQLGHGATPLDQCLQDLVSAGVLHSCTPTLYEPETHAFGGAHAMDLAHTLFHRDSHHILHHLARQRATAATPPTTQPAAPDLGQRELAILLPSAAMRAAGLDWYEQGDVWARVAAERTQPPATCSPGAPHNKVRRLMTADIGPGSALADGPLAHVTDWIAVFQEAGQQLAHLDATGRLERGLRAVLAHHVIFQWNRLGLPHHHQAVLSTLAKEVVMGTADTTAFTAAGTGPATTLGQVTSDIITSAEHLRDQLVDQLIQHRRVRTPQIIAAMRAVPRHVFVPHVALEKAYANTTVNTKLDQAGAPISCASQPEIVATMLEQLDVEPGHNVLELGAGTGYNAALLSHLATDHGHVTTIDVDQDIVDGARGALAAAGIGNVTLACGDGALGHAPNAPYDRIIATVGAHGLPPAWRDQLAPGGRLLAPLRLRGSVSRSIAFEHHGGALRSVNSEMNTFMPLRHGIADDPRRVIPLAPEAAVTLVTNSDQSIDAAALTNVLAQPRTQTWTGVMFGGPESAEWLELWLTCTLPNGLSRMPTTPAAVHDGLVTAPYPSSTATVDHDTLTYLTRRKAAEPAADGSALYEFGVIGHGPRAAELTHAVTEAAREWDRHYRGRDVTFEIQPPDTEPPAPRPGRFVLHNAISRVVIHWQ